MASICLTRDGAKRLVARLVDKELSFSFRSNALPGASCIVHVYAWTEERMQKEIDAIVADQAMDGISPG